MIELWRGNANAWECDELGHMNVRFYLAKAMEAVGNLADKAGLNGVYLHDATATLIPQAIHIKFLAEARPGAPLYIRGGLGKIGDSQAEFILLMLHAGSDRIAASFRFEMAHASPGEARSFDWPRRFLNAAPALQVETPEIARPRGIDERQPPARPALDRADEMELEQIGMGRFTVPNMDVFGRMRSEFLLGRVSDSVINFIGAFPEEWDFHQGETEARIGSALLECRILPRRWPRAGDGYVIRSGLKSYGPKIRNLVHWVLDPATGLPWWTMEGVAAPMDLDERRLIEAPDDIRARLDAAIKPGLTA